MTDDIVTRLREEPCGETWCDQCKIYGDAADEIERLRDACDYYHKMCSMIADKNFTANEEIDRLRNDLAEARHEYNKLSDKYRRMLRSE